MCLLLCPKHHPSVLLNSTFVVLVTDIEIKLVNQCFDPTREIKIIIGYLPCPLFFGKLNQIWDFQYHTNVSRKNAIACPPNIDPIVPSCMCSAIAGVCPADQLRSITLFQLAPHTEHTLPSFVVSFQIYKRKHSLSNVVKPAHPLIFQHWIDRDTGLPTPFVVFKMQKSLAVTRNLDPLVFH